MANTTNTRNTCEQCGFFAPELLMCKKANVAARPKNYACNNFKTREQLIAEYEAKRAEWMKKEEHRDHADAGVLRHTIHRQEGGKRLEVLTQESGERDQPMRAAHP